MNQNKPTVLLEYHLKQLKLPSMLREYASLAAVCSKERADYTPSVSLDQHRGGGIHVTSYK